MQFITLSGVDGSGKSTQLELLKKKLEQDGKKVAYFHAVEFSSANKLARLFKKKKAFVPGEEKAVTKASWLAIHLRKKFLLLDFIRFVLLKKALQKHHYDYLLSDRSFYDSLINIAFLENQVIPHSILEAFLPRADKVFYFDITPQVIASRDRVPEQGMDYLTRKIDLFKQKQTDWNLIMIDASRDKEAIAQEILENI